MASIDTSSRRDRRLWRLSLLVLLLLAGCASAPEPEPGPQPLVDATTQTDYRLESVAVKLQAAEKYEADGRRALAIAVIEAAEGMLPADHRRERRYLEIVKATVWARAGEGRDEEQARKLLSAPQLTAATATDSRLRGDAELANVVLLLAAADRVGAARAGASALEAFAAAGAHVRAVEAARDLAFQFKAAGDEPSAHTFARRALETAERIDDDVLLIQTCVDVGRVEADHDRYFLRAYEAAYRIDSLGWRNVVIAVAADTWYSEGRMAECIRWGDRIRTRADGKLPVLEDTGMYTADYLALLAQYAFAQQEVAKGGARGREAAELAIAIIETLPEDEQADWQELAENLRSGLLQPEREK